LGYEQNDGSSRTITLGVKQGRIVVDIDWILTTTEVAAVDWPLGQTDEGLEREFNRRAALVANALRDIPTLKLETYVPPVANHAPPSAHPLRSEPRQDFTGRCSRRGSQRNPSIELNPSTGSSSASAGLPSDRNTIVAGVWMLQPGKDRIPFAAASARSEPRLANGRDEVKDRSDAKPWDDELSKSVFNIDFQ
jgi:hypothetical protein